VVVLISSLRDKDSEALSEVVFDSLLEISVVIAGVVVHDVEVVDEVALGVVTSQLGALVELVPLVDSDSV